MKQTRQENFPNVHAFVMARGEGTRLKPLTKDVCKPCIPFGGHYRIIDFVLSNLMNGGVQKITVLGPYQDHTLIRHLEIHWPDVELLRMEKDAPTMGNAASVLEALKAGIGSKADHIAIFPSDQIFHINIRECIQAHILHEFQASILSTCRPVDQASRFGILKVKDGIIKGFLEKPATLPSSYTQNETCFINMGIYFFARNLIIRTLLTDKENVLSQNDFGYNVLPALIQNTKTNTITIDPQQPWQDVGTINEYWNTHWQHSRFSAWNIQKTMVATIFQHFYSLSPIPASTFVKNSIILEAVNIGDQCMIQQCIVDSHTIIEDGVILSMDSEIQGHIERYDTFLVIPKHSRIKQGNHPSQIIVESL